MSPTRPGGLRSGWTTGTCAAAATKAAALGLVTGSVPATVEVALPSGTRVSFPVEAEGPATAVVVKDAGDDPDCTDGARVTATVSELVLAEGAPARSARETTGRTPGRSAGDALDRTVDSDDGSAGAMVGGSISDHTASLLVAGEGVGTVTRPGLGLPVGAPAINPVPRRMILQALGEVTSRPCRVVLSVPGGEAMAAKTTNSRLGILGGISILGTTGIVRPFSTAAFRAAVVQQIDVAAAGGERHVVLATGTRSEAAARRLLPHLDAVCFVEVGDYTGVALRRAAHEGIERVSLVAMAGKITKLAAGVMMTHFHRSKVDTDLLASLARSTGAPPEVVAAASATNTARHFFEACVAAGALAPLAGLCERAAGACSAHAGGLAVEVWMVDFDGAAVLAHA